MTVVKVVHVSWGSLQTGKGSRDHACMNCMVQLVVYMHSTFFWMTEQMDKPLTLQVT